MDPGFWNQLFASAESETSSTNTLSMREVRKSGQPWLLLPCESRVAARVLDLYAPQTLRGRFSRFGFRLMLRLGLAPGANRIDIAVRPESEFVRFMLERAGGSTPRVPVFGALAGNAATPGQRLIVLVFDSRGRPSVVIKAGLTVRARELIWQEAEFLGSVSSPFAGLPRLLGRLEAEGLDAFAMEFVGGNSPTPGYDSNLSELLSGWVDTTRTVALTQTEAWKNLEKVCGERPEFQALATKLSALTIPQTLCHGDLTPWNIKTRADGRWTVLDWERGSLCGIPAWDWFHYLLQPAILVSRRSATALAEVVTDIFQQLSFRSYSETTRVYGHEKELMLAYLLHYVHVLRPSEGLESARGLLSLLSARWA